MALQLRDYQKKAIDEIRNHYARKTGSKSFETASGTYEYEARRRVLLQLATGAGKTATFAEMIKLCYQKGKPALMVVKGAKLVHQAAERLEREGVDYGIFQANNTKNTDALVQVCSIDTIYKRKIAPPADFIVIDEAHLSNGASYEWLTTHPQYQKSFFLGVSATPFSQTGLSHVGSDVIYPITIRDLIEQKFLVGGKYRTPHRPNLQGVKKAKGDYVTSQLMARLNEDGEKQKLTGSLIKEWNEYGKGKKCLLFGVNVEHAKMLGEQLSKAGAKVDHIDGKTKHGDRDRIIKSLEDKQIDVITSVGVLTTGVDIPSLECLLVCRPTASYNLWIQMLGRGTRIFPGKEHFQVIDLAGNTTKFGPIEAEMPGTVDPTKQKKERSDMVTCEGCFAAFVRADRERNETHWICPDCGCPIGPLQRDAFGNVIEHEQGELEDREIEPWEIELPALVDLAKRRGYKKGFIFHSIKTTYGEQAAEKAWRRVRAMKRWPQKAAAQRTPKSSTRF